MPGTVSSAYFLSQQPWEVGPIATGFVEAGRDSSVVGHVVHSRGCVLQSEACSCCYVVFPEQTPLGPFCSA